ncbi:porin [Hydrogenophaga sp.]|uniref:porin n=1 Tax=Hydrogenophaga sp. TaxID=1904254 RepID=UPI0027220615|nr:porin [Hydrogenophaga sp.]MDO9438356.1 porin [Hydrogenophaga sp.]
MKKTLIALAAVAASSAAFAQSTVTLSGTVDTGLEDVGGTNSPLRMVASRLGTSNWTVSGTEDLGGGLKAIFKVSTSFNSDDGTTAAHPTGAASGLGQLGNNDMWVGLQGGFGTLKLGRSFDVVFTAAQTANSTKGVTGYNTRNGTLDGNGAYLSNQVLYTTPNFGGFTASVQYAPSEVNGVDDNYGIGLAYAAGPLVLTAAHSKIYNNDGVAGGTSAATPAGAALAAYRNGNAVTLFGASYNFGVAKVLFSYTDRQGVVSTADNSWGLGVTAPVGPGELWASFDRSEYGAGTTRVIHGGYKYFLSKRTTAYVNIGHKKNPQQAFNATPATTAAQTGKGVTGWGIGLAHNF